MEGSDEGIQIFFEYYDLVPLEIGISMLFTFHDVEENIPIPILFDVKKVRTLFRLRMHTCREQFTSHAHG